MQVVSQLELQPQRLTGQLQAMMHHLHMLKQQASPEPPKSEPTVETGNSNPSYQSSNGAHGANQTFSRLGRVRPN
jgi:hypothetical protein